MSTCVWRFQWKQRSNQVRNEPRYVIWSLNMLIMWIDSSGLQLCVLQIFVGNQLLRNNIYAKKSSPGIIGSLWRSIDVASFHRGLWTLLDYRSETRHEVGVSTINPTSQAAVLSLMQTSCRKINHVMIYYSSNFGQNTSNENTSSECEQTQAGHRK